MWFFGKKKEKKSSSEEVKKDVKEPVKESIKEPVKEPSKEVAPKQVSAPEAAPVAKAGGNSFGMGVEAKFLLDTKFYTGDVKGTIKVGDEICIVNPGDFEVLPDDVITFDTPNVIKARIAQISVGVDRTSVESVTDGKANIVLDAEYDYYIRTGTVFCSNGCDGAAVRQGYFNGLAGGLIEFAHMDISEEVYSKMSLNDMSELARMFLSFFSRNPALQAPHMKDEIQTKLTKLGQNISKAILSQDCIYVLENPRTGEPHMYTRNFDGLDNTVRIDPPVIMVYTEQMFKLVSANPSIRLRKIENGKDREGIKNFLGSTFYENGATGLWVNYAGLTVSAGFIVPPPNYDGVPAIEIPVTNPLAESLILLNGQLEQVETEEEKKIFYAYSNMMFKEIANCRFIVPMKLEGDVEKKDNNIAVIKENTTISLATMQGKSDRPAVRLYTDWKRMLEAGFNPKDGWAANVVRMSDMIETFDCAINVTKPEYAAAGVYISKEMYDNQVSKFVTKKE